MVDAYAVLAAATPPNSARVHAFIVVNSEQGDAIAKSRAEAFRDANFPTSVVNKVQLESYAGPIVLIP